MVIYLLRKFLEAVIPLGLGAFLCHSLNDLVSDSVLGTVQGPAGQGCMGPSWFVTGPPRSCLVRGSWERKSFLAALCFS